MAVLSNDIYSPQNYIETITSNYYVFRNDMTILEGIENLLRLNGYLNIWNYPLTEIDHIVENNLNVVLVDVSDYDIKSGDWVADFRWFEVPEECCVNFQKTID